MGCWLRLQWVYIGKNKLWGGIIYSEALLICYAFFSSLIYKSDRFLLMMFFYKKKKKTKKKKHTFMGSADTEASALIPVYCFSPSGSEKDGNGDWRKDCGCWTILRRNLRRQALWADSLLPPPLHRYQAKGTLLGDTRMLPLCPLTEQDTLFALPFTCESFLCSWKLPARHPPCRRRMTANGIRSSWNSNPSASQIHAG